MADDLFRPDPADVPLVDPNKDYSSELIGEGKKYKDLQAAARALIEKDHFIDQVKGENAQMRQALQDKTKEGEFLSRLQETLSAQPPAQPQPDGSNGEVNALKLEDVERLVDEREAKRVANANLDAVQSRLLQEFGPTFKTRVAQLAKEMGVGTDFLTSTAAKSPDAFYRLIGLGQQKKQDGFEAPPRSSVSLPPDTSNGQKKYADFQRLRKEKGDAYYFSVPVQLELWEAAKKQGDAFYS